MEVVKAFKTIDGCLFDKERHAELHELELTYELDHLSTGYIEGEGFVISFEQILSWVENNVALIHNILKYIGDKSNG